MRNIATTCVVLLLIGCAPTGGTNGSAFEWFRDTIFPTSQGATLARHQREAANDDAKCREVGLKPQTEAYANCRLRLEEMRATERAAARSRPRGAPVMEGAEQGGKVYDSSECIGPVIMGRCKGSIVPNKAYHPTCHGTWLNGQCTGPMF